MKWQNTSLPVVCLSEMSSKSTVGAPNTMVGASSHPIREALRMLRNPSMMLTECFADLIPKTILGYHSSVLEIKS